ncbi:MAG: translation initiation factor IF-3 [bacterium]|nr:translation initiation factor IF-3 [bacterium]
MFNKQNYYRGPLINNRNKAREVRLIDETGKQLGVVSIQDALKMAHEKNLDLIQVTEKVEPPVCKIMEQGKYLYDKQKKEKAGKHNKAGELKGIRLTFGISDHDLETRARQAEKFLKKGDKVMIEIRLRGREKAHQEIAVEKLRKMMEYLKKTVELKVERDLKKQPRGFTMIIVKK